MTSTKDNHSPIAKIKDMKFCDLADKRIQKSSFEETKEQQENIERQFNKIRKTVHEQNLNLNEDRNHAKESNRNSRVEEFNE